MFGNSPKIFLFINFSILTIIFFKKSLIIKRQKDDEQTGMEFLIPFRQRDRKHALLVHQLNYYTFEKYAGTG